MNIVTGLHISHDLCLCRCVFPHSVEMAFLNNIHKRYHLPPELNFYSQVECFIDSCFHVHKYKWRFDIIIQHVKEKC